MMKENRSLLKLILLDIITLGIYGFYHQYELAKDMNVVCAGDGRHTRGLLGYLLLSLVTFGIYAFVWMYGFGERINENSLRYGIEPRCDGGTLLLWEILGSLIVVGPFIAEYKMLHGLNDLCIAYNQMHHRPL